MRGLLLQLASLNKPGEGKEYLFGTKVAQRLFSHFQNEAAGSQTHQGLIRLGCPGFGGCISARMRYTLSTTVHVTNTLIKLVKILLARLQ